MFITLFSKLINYTLDSKIRLFIFSNEKHLKYHIMYQLTNPTNKTCKRYLIKKKNILSAVESLINLGQSI